MFGEIEIFPVDEFNAAFPVFSRENSIYSAIDIQTAGNEALMHVNTVPSFQMPLKGKRLLYALFLMTAHILVLNKKDDDDVANGGTGSAGVEFKATIGSVQVERSKPNTFTSDNFDYWLQQTPYGRKLLAYLELAAPAGVYLNTPRDSVRDLV